MSIKRFSALMLTLGLVLVLSAGFATTTLAAETKKDPTKSDWWFHDVVDVDFVMQNISVPMKEGVMIIDSRPKPPNMTKATSPGLSAFPTASSIRRPRSCPPRKMHCSSFTAKGPPES